MILLPDKRFKLSHAFSVLIALTGELVSPVDEVIIGKLPKDFIYSINLLYNKAVYVEV